MKKSSVGVVGSGSVTPIALAVATEKLPLFVATFLFVLAAWQLDHFVAPHMWEHKGEKIEVLRAHGGI